MLHTIIFLFFIFSGNIEKIFTTFFQVEDNNTVKQSRNTLFDGVIVLKCLVFQVEDNNTIKQGRNTLFDGVIVLKISCFSD